jgi:hypothetical protein
MVQVDVFWSYGLRASLAAASSRQLLAVAAGAPLAVVLGALALAPGGPVHLLYRAYGFPAADEATPVAA